MDVMGFYVRFISILWDFMGFYGILWDFCGIYWVSMGNLMGSNRDVQEISLDVIDVINDFPTC